MSTQSIYYTGVRTAGGDWLRPMWAVPLPTTDAVITEIAGGIRIEWSAELWLELTGPSGYGP